MYIHNKNNNVPDNTTTTNLEKFYSKIASTWIEINRWGIQGLSDPALTAQTVGPTRSSNCVSAFKNTHSLFVVPKYIFKCSKILSNPFVYRIFYNLEWENGTAIIYMPMHTTCNKLKILQWVTTWVPSWWCTQGLNERCTLLFKPTFLFLQNDAHLNNAKWS